MKRDGLRAKMGTIRKVGDVVYVSLSPEEIITKPAYNSDAKTTWRTGVTIGHVIAFLATAYVITKAPHLMRKFLTSETKYEDGKFTVKLE